MQVKLFEVTELVAVLDRLLTYFRLVCSYCPWRDQRRSFQGNSSRSQTDGCESRSYWHLVDGCLIDQDDRLPRPRELGHISCITRRQAANRSHVACTSKRL